MGRYFEAKWGQTHKNIGILGEITYLNLFRPIALEEDTIIMHK